MKNFVTLAIMLFASAVFAADVKDADLAGSWYPGNKAELAGLIDGYIKSANPVSIDGHALAIISPHAGYQFSGPVAAYGFKALQGREIKTVILIGFTHRKSFDGISIYDRGAFRTPLGEIPVDEKLAALINAGSSRIFFYPEAFIEENSIETEVPFIQTVFKDALLIPIAFGARSYGDAVILADALADVLKDRNDYLIVASTDLSHYHPYDEANSIDKRTLTTLSALKSRAFYDAAQADICEVCGVMPVTAALLTAEKLGFDKIKILKYANSGDTFGDKSRVVGYLSAVIYREGKKKEGAAMLNDSRRKRLLQIARESITSYVRDGKRKDFTEKDTVLNEPMGAFVTLHETGELRGCIGNMAGRGPLYQTVADMAIESATGDPRFPKLTPAEIEKVDIEISVLSPMKKVSSYEEVNIPGHGVMVRKGFNSGVYLPQVADETGWTRDEFLSSLCAHKAGLPAGAWKDPAAEIYVFTAEVFGNQKEARSEE
ncbi:MAG: AmmeMemoRadiSam system protein B [Candidatus Omnitrophota bacterium]